MTKISVPCLGCPDRNENCHSICERYKEYKKSLAKQNEQIRELKEVDLEQDQIIRTRVARVAGGKLRRRRRDGN